MKSTDLHAALGMMALLMACAGCGGEPRTEAAATTGANAAQVDRVVAGRPQRKSLTLTTTQPARIEAFEQAPLYAKLAGYVKEVAVDIGDPVKAGEKLLVLSIPELGDEVEQQRARVVQAEAEVQQAVASVEAAQAAAETAVAQVAQVQAGVSRTSADFERWSAELGRLKQLATQGSVTQKVVDETQHQVASANAARDEAAAAVRSAEAARREAGAKITKAKADHRAAEARLGVSQAELNLAKTMLGYTELTAPFDGVVTQRSVDTGHFVQPASGVDARPLLTVARTDKVRVSLDLPEMEAGWVDVGDPATLRVQSLDGKELHAQVTRTSWSLDAANRSVRAEVDVPNDKSLLRPGMYASGTIDLERRVDALTLPATAILRDAGETYCFIVDSGKVSRRPIELGLRSGPEVEVLNGVDETNNVVLVRGDSLRDGQAVEILKPER